MRSWDRKNKQQTKKAAQRWRSADQFGLRDTAPRIADYAPVAAHGCLRAFIPAEGSTGCLIDTVNAERWQPASERGCLASNTMTSHASGSLEAETIRIKSRTHAARPHMTPLDANALTRSNDTAARQP